MSSTMWRVGPLGAVLADDNEDSWRATHADEGEVWAASSDLVMHLSSPAAVFESVAEEDKDDDALALAAAWLGLHIMMKCTLLLMSGGNDRHGHCLLAGCGGTRNETRVHAALAKTFPPKITSSRHKYT